MAFEMLTNLAQPRDGDLSSFGDFLGDGGFESVTDLFENNGLNNQPNVIQPVPQDQFIAVEEIDEAQYHQICALLEFCPALDQPAGEKIVAFIPDPNQPLTNADHLGPQQAVYNNVPTAVNNTSPLDVGKPASNIVDTKPRQTRYTSRCQSTEAIKRRHISDSSESSKSCNKDPDSSNDGGKRKPRRYEEEPSNDPASEKARKNAIIARRNREQKKKKMSSLESKYDNLMAKHKELQSDDQKLRGRVQSLEHEIEYLRKVLANQDALAQVFSTLGNGTSLRLRLSNSFAAMNSTGNSIREGTGGVCLHVSGNTISLDMCASCAQMADGAPYPAEISVF